MANIASLKPFVKGDPRIGQKRKGCVSVSSILRKIANKHMVVDDVVEGITRKMTVSEIIMLKLVSKAMAGDMAALKEFNDRMDGKVAQPIEHAGAGGVPLSPAQITFVGINADEDRITAESPASPSVQQAL